MKSAAIKEEADRLILAFGPNAYGKAREAMREARRRKNTKLTTYFTKAALEVARRAGREIGVNTATRYLE